MATSHLESYRILLVGKTGSGKSSTGNSILDQNVFKSRKPHDTSDGDVIACHSSVVEGRYVFVMDGTGIGDTGVDLNGGVKSLLHSAETTMKQEMSCFNAIILVHFIHEKSQVNMKNSVLAIKSALGANVLKNWGIIAVTFGDLFDVNNLDENIHSFEDWCQQQTGYFKILLEECNNRCVLFDNKTTDKNKLMEQRNKLMSVIDNMTYKPYTLDDFDSPTCKLSRQQLILMEEVNNKFEAFDCNMNASSQKQLPLSQPVDEQPTRKLINSIEEIQKNMKSTEIDACGMQDADIQYATLTKQEEQEKLLRLSMEDEIASLKHEYDKEKKQKQELENDLKIRDETIARLKQQCESESKMRQLAEIDLKIRMDVLRSRCRNTSASKRSQMSQGLQNTADLDLLIIGGTGSGKSALGNSILKRSAFICKFSTSPFTTDVACEIGEHNGRKIKVVDGPGFGDTFMNSENNINLLTKAMSANPSGYHAILLVFRYGANFTVQYEETIRNLKTILGESFIKNYCILVMTCGDLFDFDDLDLTFEQFCSMANGNFQNILREYCDRIIWFDNKTKDEHKREIQTSELIKMVDQMNPSGHRYTKENFER